MEQEKIELQEFYLTDEGKHQLENERLEKERVKELGLQKKELDCLKETIKNLEDKIKDK